MKKLLVVEDDPIIMNLIVILLEREGYAVIQAPTAEEGITLAIDQSPALILMDVALPGMDGLEATRILKKRDDTARIPIVALTAQAMKQDAERARHAGCDGFIVKPLSTREFIGDIAHFIAAGPRTEEG
jgi:two-component system cell cycle response regulator DivK